MLGRVPSILKSQHNPVLIQCGTQEWAIVNITDPNSLPGTVANIVSIISWSPK